MIGTKQNDYNKAYPANHIRPTYMISLARKIGTIGEITEEPKDLVLFI